VCVLCCVELRCRGAGHEAADVAEHAEGSRPKTWTGRTSVPSSGAVLAHWSVSVAHRADNRQAAVFNWWHMYICEQHYGKNFFFFLSFIAYSTGALLCPQRVIIHLD